MKLAIVILFISFAVSCHGKLAYRHVGCYNEQERAFPKFLGHKQKWACGALALLKGYRAFALQNGKECWTGPNAHINYNKYGISSSCKDGKGGNLSNDVYMIDGFVKHKTGRCQDKDFAGLRSKSAVKNCKTLKSKNRNAPSGIYWINPAGQKAFQAYCNMDTAGGGWTLVYSYTFTNYKSFTSSSNAVIPQPTWPSSGNTRRSTEPPLSETHYAAMRFNLWKTIGSEFMVKSNINHWIKCTAGSGSLVSAKKGSVKCQVIKNVPAKCQNVAPDFLSISASAYGPYLSRKSGSFYYYFDASTTGNSPTHDPCGTNRANQVNGVANPHGNIYIR